MSLPQQPARAIDLGDLTGSLGFLLRLAQIEAFEMFYEGLEDARIKPGEFTVIYVIQRNPGIRQGILAERLSIKRAHMTKLIRRFEVQKVVARHVPDDDRRAVELTLTPTGEALVARHTDAVLAQAGRESDRLAPDEARQLIALLRKFTGLEETP
ncbi:MarR family winged helix-turn-helix transcriptional regulator [Paracoccus tegillarcae]|uniref:MarR family transcriptional regulator n=1 Tax=Paracoccus tegillarcae TaxID=1529068 RepID=A0A2K9ECK1_9RHOB|nr:MarR family winged helix-turn-helix transcriptional regulator [Paracoccus tegillarcae]AUH32653.1 MarR family transcriptional regulator [Paracoccus tegillarcae]